MTVLQPGQTVVFLDDEREEVINTNESEEMQ